MLSNEFNSWLPINSAMSSSDKFSEFTLSKGELQLFESSISCNAISLVFCPEHQELIIDVNREQRERSSVIDTLGKRNSG